MSSSEIVDLDQFWRDDRRSALVSGRDLCVVISSSMYTLSPIMERYRGRRADGDSDTLVERSQNFCNLAFLIGLKYLGWPGTS
jgi:hypothetical protein